ncbi:hypothetical protein PR048_005522 [Dryococelus australis]|uniref:Uncharacterized protein n=1 Tax=Dryococelus australis TaxID=614101 RepID=A0ABQ9I9D3_9NEOP|nr:hypothetical protein PR048_005522 [Dryococelus australis]
MKCFGRITDIAKKLGLQSHATGEPCLCSNTCFEHVDTENLKAIINTMNEKKSNDKVNLYISGLFSVGPVARRRNRQPETEAAFHDWRMVYRTNIQTGGHTKEVQVCKQAFASLDDITRGKVDHLVTVMKQQKGPRDLRGEKQKLSPQGENIACYA